MPRYAIEASYTGINVHLMKKEDAVQILSQRYDDEEEADGFAFCMNVKAGQQYHYRVIPAPEPEAQ
jgi:hypothetical protein